jgi:putative ABC transport system permease protein
MFGIELAAGRPLLSSDGAPGAPDVAVISHELWQTIFGGDAGVVGRTLQVRKQPVTVVGVARPGAQVPRNWLTFPIVWRPVRDDPTANFSLTAVARLREGATIEQASHELAAIAKRLAAVHPDTHKGRTATVTPLLDVIVGDFERALWVFFGAVACVLLIGIGNLMSLQLARNGSREREITLRAALGASRWRVMRQLGVESMLMSALGGAAGLGLAVLAVRVVVARLPPGFPRAEDIQVDAGVAIFACGVTLLIGVIVGALPAWQVSRVDLTMRLSEGGRTATLGVSRSRVQRALIACQTAVALVLLVGAGLLGNSFYRLISRDAGMQEQGLSLIRGRLPKRYHDNAAQAAFWTSALEQVRAVEGVQAAALVVNSSGPLSGSDISTSVAPEGFAGSPLERLRASYRRVSDRYFETLGLPIVKGRPILATDTQGAEPVVVINELAATALWPGQDPVGRRLQFFNELRTVVGVIPAFRHERLDGDLEPQVFVPYVQRAGIASGSAIAFRAASAGTAEAVSAVLRRLEQDLEPTATTMADARWTLVAIERFRATVLLVFASVAVFLALVGILGLVSYTIDQRRREIAVRVVIGAVRRDILRVVSRQALVPALIGLTAGVLGAGAAARLLTSFLVDIRPLDLPTFVAALAALALAAAAASLLPARRALSIQPMDALRAE